MPSLSIDGMPASQWMAQTCRSLASQPDVKAAGVNPLLHFHSDGWKEGRDPSALFDTQYYLIHAPDVAAAGVVGPASMTSSVRRPSSSASDPVAATAAPA